MTITFRELKTQQELKQLETLESAIWKGETPIPHHMTLTLAKFGGLFLGAYDKDDRIIGFLYSFPGYTDGQPHLCSHMMGFLPEYRKQGLGVQMKWLQRDEAIRLGHTKITWTYDPLETVNGFLNIVKLGGIVRTYYPNCYGSLDDDFNRGLPTDRFLVEWFLTSNRVENYRTGSKRLPEVQRAPQVLRYEKNDNLPRPVEMDTTREEEVVLLSVPAFFQDVKRTDLTVASQWREMTGTLFSSYFARGYAVTHLIREEDMVIYVLEKQPLSALLERA